MSVFEKYYNEDGQVGVLVSRGFGAGWSTWNDDSELFMMDSNLIQMKLDEKSDEDAKIYLLDKLGVRHVCVLGWDDCEVVFLNKGTAFVINEYDGSESLDIINEEYYTVA